MSRCCRSIALPSSAWIGGRADQRAFKIVVGVKHGDLQGMNLKFYRRVCTATRRTFPSRLGVRTFEGSNSCLGAVSGRRSDLTRARRVFVTPKLSTARDIPRVKACPDSPPTSASA